MKVFITGATGFVGKGVIQRLRQADHFIRVLVRKRRSPDLSAAHQGKIEAHEGNILDPDSLLRGLDGMDAVIHLVGIISEAGESTFENIHTLGTQNMVSMAKCAGVRRFVHMSALVARENAISRYHLTKWEAEESVRTAGLDYTIFRPSLIYGPEDHF